MEVFFSASCYALYRFNLNGQHKCKRRIILVVRSQMPRGRGKALGFGYGWSRIFIGVLYSGGKKKPWHKMSTAFKCFTGFFTTPNHKAS
jgi:hypothetical protein